MQDNEKSDRDRSDEPVGEGPMVVVEGVVVGRLTNVVTGAKLAPGGDVVLALVVQSDLASWAALAEVVHAATPELERVRVPTEGSGDGA